MSDIYKDFVKTISVDNSGYNAARDANILDIVVDFYDNPNSKKISLGRPFNGQELAGALRNLASEVEKVHTIAGPVHHG